MCDLGRIDKLVQRFKLSKEESQRTERTREAFQFCDSLEEKGVHVLIIVDGEDIWEMIMKLVSIYCCKKEKGIKINI